MREMRAIDFVTKLIDLDMGKSLNLKRMFIHAISSDEVMVGLSSASKLNADWAFLTDLRDSGRGARRSMAGTEFRAHRQAIERRYSGELLVNSSRFLSFNPSVR